MFTVNLWVLVPCEEILHLSDCEWSIVSVVDRLIVSGDRLVEWSIVGVPVSDRNSYKFSCKLERVLAISSLDTCVMWSVNLRVQM